MGVDFSGITLPFSPGDLLASAVDLMGVFGPFILLGLAVLFAPKIWGLLKNVVGRGKSA